jgi:hypothetical protein
MNKSYAGGNIEKRAKEVLGALQASCPDKVWQELTIELEQRHGTMEGNWKNRLSTPKTLVIVFVIIAGATFGLWRYLASKQDMPGAYTPKPVVQTAKQPAPAPKVTPTPTVKKDSVIVAPIAIKVDSPKHTNIPTSAVVATKQNILPIVAKQPEQKSVMAERRDSLALVRRHRRMKDTSSVSMNTRMGFSDNPDTTDEHHHSRAHDSSAVSRIQHDSVN